MAMAMGVASLAVTAPKHALATPRASVNKGEKEGFLDWFRTAFDKDSLSETDAVLAKVSGSGKSDKDSDNTKSGKGGSIYVKAGSPPKKDAAAPPKKIGFNLFGKKGSSSS